MNLRTLSTTGLASAFAALALLASCSLYNEPRTVSDEVTDKYDLKIVQIDDFGTFWDPARADLTLRSISEKSRGKNMLVVVFIHGWHHNADPDDPNLTDFKKTLESLRASIDMPQRKKWREKWTGSPDIALTGIYIGWRGRSLPGDLDYATMWWRKSAAERAGDGDVSEFIQRLDQIYLRRNASNPNVKEGTSQSLMGLVTIGHSFGGQVLLRSVARSLEYPLIEQAPCESRLLDPGALASPRTEAQQPIGSLGDLNILVNPATEAYQFARIDALYRQLKYKGSQTPQLVVFSADNDGPRAFFFPIARGLTRTFRPEFRSDNDDYQGALWGTALGEFTKQQTHRLDLTKNADSLTDDDYDGVDQGKKIREFDFSGPATFSGVELLPLSADSPGAPPRIPNSPVIVAVTHEDIVDGHTGIFRDDFRNFLIGYVAYIEGKRFLLRAQKSVALRPGNDASQSNITPVSQIVCGE